MRYRYSTSASRVSAALLSVLMAVACSHPQKTQPKDGLNVTVTRPSVHFDFKAIEKSGRLRMITRYSSNTYFLHQGLEYGFEYELLSKFAKEQHLSLDVIVVQPGQNPYDMLNRGEGDVIAANYTITPARRRYVAFTHPYNLVDQVMVFSGSFTRPPQNIREVLRRHIPVSVRKNSSYYQQLTKLKQKGYPFFINPVSNKKDTESLLFDVSQGKYLATVADDNIFQACNNYMDNLIRGPVLAKHDSIAWALRNNAPVLKEKMDNFIDHNFRLDGTADSPKRSAFLNILRRRYFKHGPQIAGYYSAKTSADITGMISPYDDLFKKVADSAHLDWLMLAAITAQETQFNPRAKSWTGAVGLMQVLPRYSEVDSEKMLYDPQTNVREGVRIILQQLNHYSYMDSTERWHFALAAYNAGKGHVADARRLAIDLNEDPNNWKFTAGALLKLMDRSYYKNARHGFCRGIETVNYVQNIMNRYHTYKNILAMRDAVEEKNRSGVLNIFHDP